MTKRKGAKTYTSPALKRVLEKVSPKELRRTEQRMLLAAKIADAIEVKGYSKKEFAEKLDKNPSEITKWLSGTHNFTSDTLFDIQDELGIDLIEFDRPAITVVYRTAINMVVVAAPAPPVIFSHEDASQHWSYAQVHGLHGDYLLAPPNFQLASADCLLTSPRSAMTSRSSKPRECYG